MKLVIIVLIIFGISVESQALQLKVVYPKFAQPDVKSSGNFVKILPGSFKMGSPLSEAGRYDHEVQHEVTISSDLEAQSTVVTQAQYFTVTGANPSKFKSQTNCMSDFISVNGIEMCPNNPVESVSWEDTQKFIEQLNASDLGYLYRLPTEAEWEYFARAGSQTAFWYGNDYNPLRDYAWFYENSDYLSHSVGTKPANPWGLYDVHGNVWQWVSDWNGDYSTSPQSDPTGPATGWFRVIRGGSWANYSDALRSAFRCWSYPDYRSDFVGFRLVRVRR